MYYTVLSEYVLYKPYDDIQIYPLMSFWFVNIYQDEVPQYGVCLPCVPHNGSVSEPLTHTHPGID